MVVGIITMLNAFFNLYVVHCHPGFKASGLTFRDDPTLGYSSGEAAIQGAAASAIQVTHRPPVYIYILPHYLCGGLPLKCTIIAYNSS